MAKAHSVTPLREGVEHCYENPEGFASIQTVLARPVWTLLNPMGFEHRFSHGCNCENPTADLLAASVSLCAKAPVLVSTEEEALIEYIYLHHFRKLALAN